MAKKRGVRASNNFNATRRVRAPKSIRHALPKRHLATIINPYQDNRTWHPERTFRPALSISKRGAVRTRPLILAKPTKFQTPRLSEPLRFPDPKKVLVCIRRDQRKRVLHATGAAGGRVRKPRRNQWSDVKC